VLRSHAPIHCYVQFVTLYAGYNQGSRQVESRCLSVGVAYCRCVSSKLLSVWDKHMGGEISCEWWALSWLDRSGYLRVGCVVFCMLILRRWRLCMVSACRLHCVVGFYVNVALVFLCCGVTALGFFVVILTIGTVFMWCSDNFSCVWCCRFLVLVLGYAPCYV
jgi:hypothetical protein